MKSTTLKSIKSFKPCADGWRKLLKNLGKTRANSAPLLMSTILKSNGINDALWCLRAFYAEHRQSVIDFACDCAEKVLFIWEEWADKNAPKHKDSPRKAIKAARNENSGAAASKIAAAAFKTADAACTAAYDVYAASSQADEAIRAADARNASLAASAASCAARAAFYKRAAKRAANAAYDAAARAAASTKVYADERKEQEKLLIKYFG